MLQLIAGTVQCTSYFSEIPMLWCCANDEERASRPKTVHIFLGYFFILNYCLGTGFLGVPYSFFYSGYLAAIPTLVLTAFLTWLTSVWLLEVMARAQVNLVIMIMLVMHKTK